ncbi:polysaccharide deacetylase family protein [Methylomonas sp. MgM2]
MNRFIILMYHMISTPESDKEIKYACPPELFEKHMAHLRLKKFNIVSLKTIEDYFVLGKSIPQKTIAITLDDGFEDNYTNAYPILTKYNIPATIFLTTGHIGSTNIWMESRGFPSRKLLSWTQIKEMSRNNITFGAHTVNHPKLPDLTDDIACQEITASKTTIEQQLGKECNYFAYPFGLFTDENRKQVEMAGFKLACSTRSGFNTPKRDPYLLHRIEVYGNDSRWRLKQKITFGMNDSSHFYPVKYYTSRLIERFKA